MALTIWKNAGYYMLFFLAGLQAVPAMPMRPRSSTAQAWQRLRYVTLPYLKPTIGFVLVIGLLNVVTQVDHVFVLTKGGPSDSTNLLLFYVYQEAVESYDRQGVGRDRHFAGDPARRSPHVAAPLSAPRGARAMSASMPGHGARGEISPRLGYAADARIVAAPGRCPFIWMLVAAFRPERFGASGMASLFPTISPTLANFREAWESADFIRYGINTW